jgi:hypothetical protein
MRAQWGSEQIILTRLREEPVQNMLFVIETPLANLVAGIKWFLGTYTSRSAGVNLLAIFFLDAIKRCRWTAACPCRPTHLTARDQPHLTARLTLPYG